MMISDVKHLFMYFQLFLCFLGKNVYSGPLPFVNWNFWVLLSFVSFLYISGINLYQKDVLQEKNFPICMFPCFLFTLLIISLFLVQKLFSLILSHLFIFDLLLWCHIKKCIIVKTKSKLKVHFRTHQWD